LDHNGTAGKENKQSFKANYGIEYEIPSKYEIDSTFFIKDPKYSLKLVHHIEHNNDKVKIQEHNSNGE
jgi:hypothetical protein